MFGIPATAIGAGAALVALGGIDCYCHLLALAWVASVFAVVLVALIIVLGQAQIATNHDASSSIVARERELLGMLRVHPPWEIPVAAIPTLGLLATGLLTFVGRTLARAQVRHDHHAPVFLIGHSSKAFGWMCFGLALVAAVIAIRKLSTATHPQERGEAS
jgi:hypothetical protein